MIYLLLLVLLFNIWPIFSMNDDDKVQFIEGLLATGKNINEPQPELGYRTPLEYAAADDETHDLLVRLLDHGAPIENHQLDFPSHQCAYKNFRTLFETSKKQGLHIPTLLNYQDCDDEAGIRTPFLYACQYDVFNDLIEDMVSHGAELMPNIPTKETCLHRAVLYEAIKNVATLLPIMEKNLPYSVDAQDDEKNTALHYACGWAHGQPSYPIVRLLCTYKANPNIENKQGIWITPFMAAIKSLQYLEYYPSQTVRMSKGHIKKCADALRIIKTLLMHDAQPDQPSWHDSIILTGLRDVYNRSKFEKECLTDLHKKPTSYISILPHELVHAIKDILHAQIDYYEHNEPVNKKRKEPTP